MALEESNWMAEFPVPVDVKTLVAMTRILSVAASDCAVIALEVHVADVTVVLGSVVLVRVAMMFVLARVLPFHL